MTDSWRLLDQKLTVPSEMRTAEWSMLPQWLRERSFYMAGVARAEMLDEFRREAGRLARGGTSIPQAEKSLGQFLDRIGYQPEPGEEGTIRDLRSWRRMRVALRTNVTLLQGWQQKERGLRAGPAAAFPAWELVRLEPRGVEREWRQRFVDAGGILLPDGRMMALKTSDVWPRLGSRELFPDALGVDYPPFAWGSGMGWRGVPFRECVDLGLLPDGWQAPQARPVASPNQGLRSTPAVTDDNLRRDLSERMRGMVEWEGEVLRFTDPNGTQPADAARLVRTWDRGMPEAFAELPDAGLPQRGAFLRWAAAGAGDVPTPADAQDLARLAGRLVPAQQPAALYRRVAAEEAQVRMYATVDALRNPGGMSQWLAGDDRDARLDSAGWQILYVIRAPKRAADMAALLDRYAPERRAAGAYVYAGRTVFQVVSRALDEARKILRMELEERP